MALISLHNVRIAFGGPPVLENLSFDIHKGTRICLLGRNGSGKSTLLKILGGELKPDAGGMILSPGLRVAVLPQEVPDGVEGTAFEAVAHGLEDREGWPAGTAAKCALDRVRVAPDLPFASLSGGMRRRVFLARALAREPDVLLLDEPTNHLDLNSISWLESFLLSSRMTLLFVTHDRRLLKRLATRIVELDRGRAVDWSCDYPTFLERRQAVLEAEEKEWERFDKRLAQEEAWIRRGVKARRTRNEGRVRALERMREERRKRRQRDGKVSMALSDAGRSGERVLEARDIAFAYGEAPVVRGFSFVLGRGDRVGVIGPNGCGKTTLLNLLLGRLAPQKGTIEFGANVAFTYFDQLRQGIDPNKSVWENVAPHGGETVSVNGVARHVMGYLQDFLFTTERARTPVRNLSGGERHRLLLARLFTQPANLLVFDEPTNDLDAETLELLEEVLLDYQGTLIVVSHDREFLNNVVTSVLAFGENGTVREFVGGYDDWERTQIKPAETEKPRPETRKERKPAAVASDQARKLSFKEKRELEGLPGLIESLETEQRTLHEQLADFTQLQRPGFVAASGKRLAEIETALKDAYERWVALEGIK